MPVAVPKPDYFELLDLNPDDAGIQEIRAAYKKLALQWHPDRHTTDKELAQEKFVEISEAYRALLEECQHKKRGRSPRAKSGRQSASTSSASSSPSRRNETSPVGAEQPKAEKSSKERRPEDHHLHPSGSPQNSPQSSPRSKPRDDIHPARSNDDSRTDSSTPHSRTHDLPPQHKQDSHSPSPSSPRAKDSSRDHPAPSKSDNDHAHFSSSRERHSPQRSDESDHSHKKSDSMHKKSKLDDDLIDYEFINLGTPIPPLRPSKSTGRIAEDWVFPLHLTLEDLYYSATHHYRITRTLRSGKTESVKIDVDISSSWRNGTKIRVPGAGNERKDGTFQDIVFVVEEEPHPRFTRVGDNVTVRVQVPWADVHPRSHAYPPRESEKLWREDEVYVQGLDGEEFALSIPRTLVEGADGTRIVGAGMPVRKGGKIIGKGDLIVKWEFVFPETEHTQRSRWQNLKKVVYWKS